jgi:hypothetical protein
MRLTLVALAGLGLLSCQKHLADPAGVPADIEARFEQEFRLHYQQQVRLPSAARPDLTVRMADLAYTCCPEGTKCFVASFAWPTLELADAQGNRAELVLPRHANSAQALALLDTASVVIGGQRYGVQYARWEVERELATGEMPRKSDLGLWLRLTRR